MTLMENGRVRLSDIHVTSETPPLTSLGPHSLPLVTRLRRNAGPSLCWFMKEVACDGSMSKRSPY